MSVGQSEVNDIVKITRFGFIGLVMLVVSASLPAHATPISSSHATRQVAQRVPDHVRKMWEALRHLRWCHNTIDTDSGTSYGGFREKAEVNIKSAMEEVEKAVEYYRVNVAHSSEPYHIAEPNLGEPAGRHWDHLRRIREGIRRLERTREILSAEAGTNYGGHRENATEHIDHAIKHLHDAEDWFHTHH